MIKFDPSRRISASQALNHDYFKDLRLYPPIYSYCNGSVSSVPRDVPSKKIHQSPKAEESEPDK